MRLLSVLALLLSGGCWCTAEDVASLPPSIPVVDRKDLMRFFGTAGTRSTAIDCPATGIPTPHVRWFHNDKKVAKDSRYFEIKGADSQFKLLFRAIENMFSIEHAGVFYCEAENDYGTARSDRITMAQIGALTADDKQTLPFNLYGYGELPTAKKGGYYKYADKIVWTRNGVDLDQDTEHYFVDLQGNLRILSVQEKDFDKTFAFNGQTSGFGIQTAPRQYIIEKGGTEPGRVALKLIYPERSNPQNMTVLIGQRLELQCVYFARAADYTITTVINWKYPASAVVDINKDRSYNRRLIINEVKKDSEGAYVCKGSESGGSTTQEYTFNVKVQSFPEWSTKNFELKPVFAVQGGTATFTCSAIGEPKPMVAWSIDGKPGVSSDQIQGVQKGDSLEFSGVSTDDQFTVSCNSSNVHGYVFGNAYLKVVKDSALYHEPQAPAIVKQLGSEDTRITCTVTFDPVLTVTWRWTKNGRLFDRTEGDVPATHLESTSKCSGTVCNSTLVIVATKSTRPEDEAGTYKCTAEVRSTQDATFTNDKEASWDVQLEGIPIDLPVEEAGIPFWVWIIVVVALIIIIVVIIICCCCMRKKGQDYPLDALERKAGHDPAQELLDTGYHDYERPPPYEDAPANHIELDEDDKPLDSDSDSMAEYGDIDTGKFNEDGSFIGQYGSDRKKKPKVGDTNV